MVWKPPEWHGTSLQRLDPADEKPEFYQRGVAFLTPWRLPEAWAIYQALKISQEEAERYFGTSDSEEGM